MMRKIIVFGVFFLISLNLFANNQEKSAGYALLDKIIGTFREMAVKGTGGEEALNKPLQEMMAQAKKAKAQGQLDPLFYMRFTKLLMLIKLMVINDPEGILSHLREREINEFIEEVKGEAPSEIGGPKIGIVSDAIAEEILDLRFYLDNKENKAKSKEEFFKKFNEKARIK
jgi:hypothetical protein